MIVKSFGFENYKGFRNAQNIEVRPITILIGRNNCGKSTIARLPVLLARGLVGVDGPLSLDTGSIEFGSSLVDLIYQKNPHGSLGLKLELIEGRQVLILNWRLQHFDEFRMFAITEFRASNGENEFYRLTWQGTNPLTHSDLYRINDDNYPTGVAFRGLLPNDWHTVLVDHGLKAYVSSFSANDFEQRITYLGPFRERAKRFYSFPSGQRQDVGPAGSKAAEVLGGDLLRQKGKVLKMVSAWFENHLGGWQLDLSRQGDRFSLILRDKKNSSMEVNIADTGTGIAQVLPIVVQRYFEEISGQSNFLEIIEQPELHLHPGAHASIADLYIEAIKHSTTPFIVETHSENFLLRIQLRIAESKLRPDDVIIYWVDEGDVRTIQVNDRGELDSWPEGVFAEDYEEVIRIRQAQRTVQK